MTLVHFPSVSSLSLYKYRGTIYTRKIRASSKQLHTQTHTNTDTHTQPWKYHINTTYKHTLLVQKKIFVTLTCITCCWRTGCESTGVGQVLFSLLSSPVALIFSLFSHFLFLSSFSLVLTFSLYFISLFFVFFSRPAIRCIVFITVEIK